jgi:cell division protease FtsH
MLTEHRDDLEKIAQALLEKEIIFQSDLEDLLGKRPFDTRTTYDEFVNGDGAENAEVAEKTENAEVAEIAEEKDVVVAEQIPDILNEDTNKDI